MLQKRLRLNQNDSGLILSTNIASRRYEQIASQVKYIRREAEQLGYDDHDGFVNLIDEATDDLKKAQNRKQRLQELQQQNAAEKQLTRIYPRFLDRIDSAQYRLQDAQQVLLYLSVHEQQEQQYSKRLTNAERVCQELSDRLEFDVEYLPVIWTSFASFDIIRGDFYALHLPRGTNWSRTSPIIAHEIGHSLYDCLENSLEQEFREQLEQICSEFPSQKRPIVRSTWRQWFMELTCDSFGALTYGPAYLITLIERLCRPDPVDIPRRVTPHVHPPPKLRYETVLSLLQSRLPDSLNNQLDAATQEFEQHLSQLDISSNEQMRYKDWADQNLIESTKKAAMSRIDCDLESLAERIQEEANPSDYPSQRHRLKTNNKLLSSYSGGY